MKQEAVSVLCRVKCHFSLTASAPTFPLNQMRKTIIITKGQEVVIECKPQASPKPTITWKKGDKALRENKRSEACSVN